jgi:hypothetical protein
MGHPGRWPAQKRLGHPEQMLVGGFGDVEGKRLLEVWVWPMVRVRSSLCARMPGGYPYLQEADLRD